MTMGLHVTKGMHVQREMMEGLRVTGQNPLGEGITYYEGTTYDKETECDDGRDEGSSWGMGIVCMRHASMPHTDSSCR